MSVYPRIVVGTDGSTTATRAVRRAAVLAAALDVPLLVACAYRRAREEDMGPPSARARMPGEGWQGQAYQGANAIAHDGASIAAATAPVTVEATASEGDPADALLDAADTHDLVVVGGAGRSGPRRLLGSVANRVSHHIGGDLLVVHTDAAR